MKIKNIEFDNGNLEMLNKKEFLALCTEYYKETRVFSLREQFKFNMDALNSKGIHDFNENYFRKLTTPFYSKKYYIKNFFHNFFVYCTGYTTFKSVDDVNLNKVYDLYKVLYEIIFSVLDEHFEAALKYSCSERKTDSSISYLTKFVKHLELESYIKDYLLSSEKRFNPIEHKFILKLLRDLITILVPVGSELCEHTRAQTYYLPIVDALISRISTYFFDHYHEFYKE